jgi:Uncharacterized protein conserved in bacteria
MAMMKNLVSAACAILFMTSTANAAGEGSAVGVNPDALSRRGNIERTLVVGSDVSIGERIVTGPTGHVQLLFKDQTRLVVGPRSTLEIEAYLLNGSAADRFAVNALSGTFRFISGNSPKAAYSIDTPTASIAVRGTEFDLTVGSGLSLVMLYDGALTLCRGSACVDLARRCDLGVVGSGIADMFTWPEERRNDYAGYFPLPHIQAGFLQHFRIGGGQACLQAPQAVPNASLADQPSEPPSYRYSN